MNRLKLTKSINYYRLTPSKQLYYSVAVTNRGKCVFCKKGIPKKTPIFWYWAKFRKTNNHPVPPGNAKTATELDIKRKICFRCIEEDIFKNILRNYKEETKKIQQLRKHFRRALKGKKCKRAIENELVLEELQKEDYTKNFDSSFVHK